MSGEIHIDMEITDTLAESTGQNQANTSQNDGLPREQTAQQKQLLDEIKEEVKKLQNPTAREGTTSTEEKSVHKRPREVTKIQRVPKIMRQRAPEYFVPKELSIGPIHGADEQSSLFKRKLKLQLAACFVSVSGNDVDSLFGKIQSAFKEDIKTYFVEIISSLYSTEKLLKLVFLDGCAMLGFIHANVNKKLEVLGIKDDQAALIQQDLFLLENQIPYKVLELLMSGSKNEEDLKKDFFRFIYQMSNTTFPRDSTSMFFLERSFSRSTHTKNAAHILDLLREVILFQPRYYSGFNLFNSLLDIICLTCCCIPMILMCCTTRFFGKSNRRLPKRYNKMRQSFRGVQELKTAGIKIMPCTSLSAISFHSPFSITARLTLPRLVVDESTQRKLRNLVAYEMCLSETDPNMIPWVTSYVKLLDLFIDKEHTDKELREADILQNFLSSDDEAAKVINKMGSERPSPQQDAYVDERENIGKHCRSKFARWMFEFYNAHFSSPWTVLALFAATTVLVLTTIQTWYAVYPK